MRDKDTTYFLGPHLQTSTPQICVTIIPWDLSMWCKSEILTSSPRIPCNLPYFSSALWTPPPDPSPSAYMPALTSTNRLTPGYKPLNLSFQDSSVVKIYWTFVPPPSALSAPIWGCSPLYGHLLHRKLCCTTPSPITVYDVPLRNLVLEGCHK